MSCGMPRVKTIVSVQDDIELPEARHFNGVAGKQQPEAVNFGQRLRMVRRIIASLVRHILICELPHCRCHLEVSLFICDDERIRELNATYLGRDRPTDVLSFPQLSMGELEHLKRPHKCTAAVAKPLGDIVISIGAVQRQARRYKHSQIDELVRLVAHGLLHLLGYEDADDAKRRSMAKRERELIRTWRLGS